MKGVRFVGLVLATSVTALTVFAIRNQIFSFIKIEEMRIPYICLFPIFLLVGAGLIIKQSLSPLKLVAFGPILGQVSGTFALTTANFFIMNGFERNFKSFIREGFFESIITDTAFAFMIGAWFFGLEVMVLYCMYCLVLKNKNEWD
jgi:hypothetical protein